MNPADVKPSTLNPSIDGQYVVYFENDFKSTQYPSLRGATIDELKKQMTQWCERHQSSIYDIYLDRPDLDDLNSGVYQSNDQFIKAWDTVGTRGAFHGFSEEEYQDFMNFLATIKHATMW